jgi:UDP-N-acetyl-D-glucosamine dehydrogenase
MSSSVARPVLAAEETYSGKLAAKLKARTARVGVVGLGYVGLPLAVEYARIGYAVTGIDLQDSKVDALNGGSSYIQDVPSGEVASLVAAGKLTATSDFSVIADLDTINICVPTPLRKTKDPDMTYIVSACEQIAKHLHPGMLVILESTTYPGTTDELVRPMLETVENRAGEEIFLCFSPERVDPGNEAFRTKNIPKVVGGVTAACTKMGRLFYSQALDTVVPVKHRSPKW